MVAEVEFGTISCIVNYYSWYHTPAVPHEAKRRPSSSIYASAGDNIHNHTLGLQ